MLPDNENGGSHDCRVGRPNKPPKKPPRDRGRATNEKCGPGGSTNSIRFVRENIVFFKGGGILFDRRVLEGYNGTCRAQRHPGTYDVIRSAVRWQLAGSNTREGLSPEAAPEAPILCKIIEKHQTLVEGVSGEHKLD